jgi:hypothetical protein
MVSQDLKTMIPPSTFMGIDNHNIIFIIVSASLLAFSGNQWMGGKSWNESTFRRGEVVHLSTLILIP